MRQNASFLLVSIQNLADFGRHSRFGFLLILMFNVEFLLKIPIDISSISVKVTSMLTKQIKNRLSVVSKSALLLNSNRTCKDILNLTNLGNR